MKKRIKPRIIDVIEDDGRWLDLETMEYFEEEQLEDIVNTEDDKNLSFIESLEKELVNLEKEFNKWWEDNHNGININHSMYWYMEKCAEHFFELGKNSK